MTKEFPLVLLQAKAVSHDIRYYDSLLGLLEKVSISSPSGEGGECPKSMMSGSAKKQIVSISSPSGEGGEIQIS